jgi:methionyl-tRNA synthetase
VKRFFISTPIYYVNARPHLGHAYTTIVADCAARFHRAMGREVFFLTGTDEHGDKIVKAAEEAGTSPREYADEISKEFRELWPNLNISNDDFIRTTEARHVEVVQDILQRVYDSGDIYFGEYGGHYCFGCETFYTEKDLLDGKCPDHGTEPEYIAEKNYFFRMAEYQGWLLEHIEKQPDFIRPERYRNEVVSLLKSGVLEDLCISRPKSRLTWGIELPFDSNFVTYVWFDALINYVSALGYPHGPDFHKFWPSAQHLVAKDILKPHAVFWPTMLKAAGIDPYRHLNVHGYWLVKESKMSKSVGNVVAPLDMVGKYGLDPFRYFLMREMRFGGDASFSEEALVGRLNADLANDLGNLFSRVLSMTHKYFDGKVPPMGEAGAEDEEIRNLGRHSLAECQRLFARMNFSLGLDALWELVRALNKYVDGMQPWALHKSGNSERLAAVMYVCLEHMRKVALHLWPVMPETCGRMLEQLGVEYRPEEAKMDQEIDAWGVLREGTGLAKASNLFPRVERPRVEAEKSAEKGNKPKKENKKQAETPGTIEFGDFQKLDLRVGKVTSAEKHPDADKLLVLKVDLGEDGPRQIVAGLAEHFSPEELQGRQVVVVANLAPRKLRGVESQGMVLAAHGDEGLRTVTVSEAVEAGSKVS